MANLTHPFKPYYNKDSQILILGSFPSVVSRQKNFYYAHPSNRFWPVLSAVYQEKIKDNIASKKAFLKKHKIALYDVCYTCDIEASKDDSIKNVIPTNLDEIIQNSNIKYIYTTGSLAYKLYNKYHYPRLKIKAISLPSPSSANAKMSIDYLISVYKMLINN